LAINRKQFASIVTGLAILGVTIYSIKKYYDSRKQDEQAIDLEEAKKLVKDDERRVVNIGLNDDLLDEIKDDASAKAYYHHSKNRHDDSKSISGEKMTELVNDARDQASYDSSFMTPGSSGPDKLRIGLRPEELAATMEQVEEEEDIDPLLDGDDPEELQNSKGYFEETKDVIDDLRYEPNSIDAREQFINMELAALGRDNDTRDVVAMLYDHPFIPTCDEDQNLKTRLIDHRIKFFGVGSKWNNQVMYSDLIMYYGKSAEYNCGDELRNWVDYFLTCADINNITLTSDEFEERIKQLNNHNYYNEDTASHGLFGLTSAQMTEACITASKRIDERVTYDIEFHQFVQGVVMGRS
jgi:hypothetical protein